MAYSETRFAPEPWWDSPWVGPAAILTAAVVIFVGSYALESYEPTFGAGLPSSTVKVELAQGHGSGVHIGDGLVLTAAHVASEGAEVALKLDDGTTRDATVVWASKANDVALLRTSPAGLSASPLNCSPPIVGQAVTARGNPMALEFVTTHGHIIGAPMTMEKWQSVVPVDMVVLPGMSGGPVFNPSGEVVGISIAVLTVPLGFSSSVTGLGMIVPASVVCGLLGRS